MIGRRACGTVLLVLPWLSPLPAGAQAAAVPRVEIAMSGGWWGGMTLASLEPALSGPQVPTGLPVTYFDGESALEPGPAAEVRVGWRVWRGLHAEATGGMGVNRLVVSVRRDIEQAPPVEASTTLMQFTVEGGVALDLPRAALLGRRLVPFVSGGGGYLRHLYEDRLLVETGRTAYAGGGVRWRPRRPASRPPRLIDRFGLRTDVRLVMRAGGAILDDAWRRAVTVTGGVSCRF